MGGIAFWGSARDVFWDAITRGVRKEVLEQFRWVDDQVRRYNRKTALDFIDEAAGLLIIFARGVRRDAMAKDRILRGDGIDFPPKMTGVDGTGHPINQLFHIWELEANRPLELRSGTKLQS